MTLSELIISYRKQNDLSQRRFADICGLSNGYISMLERGENPKTKQPITPTLPHLKKLAKGMGMTVNELFSKVEDINISLKAESERTIRDDITDEDIKFALFDGDVGEITDEMYAEVKAFAEFVKAKYKKD